MKKNITSVFAAAVIIFTSCSGDDNGSGVSSTSKQIERPAVIGMKIPNMKLKGFQAGKIGEVDLSLYRGKWIILFFYPSDFTFVCPTELKELADFYEEFRKARAEVFSVSTDSVFVHKAWHASNDSVKTVKYTMLSDRNGALSKTLGVYNYAEGASHRATFIFDPDGNCIAHETHHDAIGRSAGELLRKLDAAAAVKSGGGGLCPAGWKPGDNLIKPESKQ